MAAHKKCLLGCLLSQICGPIFLQNKSKKVKKNWQFSNWFFIVLKINLTCRTLGRLREPWDGAPLSAEDSFFPFSFFLGALFTGFAFFSFLPPPGQQELSCSRKQNKYNRNTILTPYRTVKKPWKIAKIFISNNNDTCLLIWFDLISPCHKNILKTSFT